MSSFILTEKQLLAVIKENINISDLLTEQEKRILSLNDLAEVLSRTGVMKEVIEQILVQEFKRGGDDAILKLFKDSVGLELDNIRKGRYIFK